MLELPGTQHHQDVLKAVLQCYKEDPRILAVIVFGSLSKGNWDEYSDIDLDIIIKDDCITSAAKELQKLTPYFDTANQELAITVYRNQDEVDVVYKSLLQLSVKYHTLDTMHPNVVSNMFILKSSIPEDVIKLAGENNQQSSVKPANEIVSECIRHILGVDCAVKRNNLWLAEDLLYRIRSNLLKLFTESKKGQRPYYYFEKNASESLQYKMLKTFSQGTKQSITVALFQVILLLKEDLDELSSFSTSLSSSQSFVLSEIEKSLELE